MKTFTTLALATSLTLGAGCGSGFVLPDGGGNVNCEGDFGTSAAAVRLHAFVRATTSFATTAAALDASLLQACRAMATDLGATPAELMATGQMTETEVACRRAAALISAEMRAVRAAAGVSVYVEVTPPACRVDVDAYNRCAAECDVTYQPGTATVMCEGGELRGACSGSCTGTCAAMASGTCSGACEGTCMGSCMGSCQGRCDGTCATRAADGSCNGACTGTCQGTCSAMCTGQCSGQCVAMASATCSGECRGMCSVAFTQPTCTGRVVPPMVNADCRASCDTRFNATAMCTPGAAAVRVAGTLSTDLQTRAARLRTTLEANYGAFLQVRGQLERLVIAGRGMVDSASGLSTAVTTVGLNAASCAVSVADRIRIAVPRVQVSVEVSVAVSASVAAN